MDQLLLRDRPLCHPPVLVLAAQSFHTGTRQDSLFKSLAIHLHCCYSICCTSAQGCSTLYCGCLLLEYWEFSWPAAVSSSSQRVEPLVILVVPPACPAGSPPGCSSATWSLYCTLLLSCGSLGTVLYLCDTQILWSSSSVAPSSFCSLPWVVRSHAQCFHWAA